jgi:hypothetical protein
MYNYTSLTHFLFSAGFLFDLELALTDREQPCLSQIKTSLTKWKTYRKWKVSTDRSGKNNPVAIAELVYSIFEDFTFTTNSLQISAYD